jgi:hypothetical protein
VEQISFKNCLVQSFAGTKGAKGNRETSAKTAAISAHSYTIVKKGMRKDKKKGDEEVYEGEKNFEQASHWRECVTIQSVECDQQTILMTSYNSHSRVSYFFGCFGYKQRNTFHHFKS